MQVSRTRKEIAQLIGAVFIQKSNVNLLSTVLDTPEYFWSAPDNLQVCPSPLFLLIIVFSPRQYSAQFTCRAAVAPRGC